MKDLVNGHELQTLIHSSKNTPIQGVKLGSGERAVFIFGGVHADEVEGIKLVNAIMGSYKDKVEVPENISIIIIPVVNPDGEKANSRYNGNGVDLNRNMPTIDWKEQAVNDRYPPGPAAGSEVESKLIVDLIEHYNPVFIFSVHSYKEEMINVNGECTSVANILQEKSGMKIKGDIGYPTPGALGTYAGLEREIPTITLELLRKSFTDRSLEQNRDGIIEAINFLAK